jgi:hypothetical protein
MPDVPGAPLKYLGGTPNKTAPLFEDFQKNLCQKSLTILNECDIPRFFEDFQKNLCQKSLTILKERVSLST